MSKTILVAAVLASASLAQAQAPAGAPAPAPATTTTSAPAAPAATATSPAKKALIARLLQLQQPGIEQMARTLVEQPALRLMQQAAAALQQRVPADRRETVAREIDADLRKYADEVVPVVRDKAINAAPSTIGAVVEQNFTEDELRQMIALLESPVNAKFQKLAPEMQRALGEKLVADSKSLVEPRLRTLEQSIARRLGVQQPAASAPAAAPAPGPTTAPAGKK